MNFKFKFLCIKKQIPTNISALGVSTVLIKNKWPGYTKV